MSESPNPHIRELLINKFGEIPELDFSSRYGISDLYRLKEFDPDRGVASFEGHSVTNPDDEPFSVVDYTVLDQKGELIGRRQKGMDENRVTYMRGDKLVNYELFGNFGGYIHIEQPTRKKGWDGIQVARAVYVADEEDRLYLLEFSPQAAKNDQFLGLRAKRHFTDLIAGRKSSPNPFYLPEIVIELDEDEIKASLKNTGSSQLGNHELGRIEIGNMIAPKELEPYKFRFSQTNNSYELSVEDGKGWNGKLTVPTLNLQRLAEIIKGNDWTTISQAFPVELSF